MSGALFASRLFTSPVAITPELIELHARVARDLRRAAFIAMVRHAVRSVRHWLRPQAGLAASAG